MRNIQKRLALVALLGVVLGMGTVANFGLPPITVHAHSGATGIVKERMMAMKQIAAATKAIAQLDWSNPEAARVILHKNGTVLQGHASEIVALFPKGSARKPSEAIAAIWERPREFERLAKLLETAGGALILKAESANSKSDIADEFAKAARSCKSCHAAFRLK